MLWNWKRRNWPNFSFSSDHLKSYEREFLHKAGELSGSLKYISEDEHECLKVDLMSNEAYKTSEIEGEILDRASLQSSIKRHFGLRSDHRKIPPAEHGIAEMMVDLYRTYDKPLTDDQLFKWHSMIMLGRRDLHAIGKYRTHEDPMQIVSGRVDLPQVHFEAPPSSQVPKEMETFVNWYNQTKSIEPLTKAGIAHLYFESIHPFEDGNGRIGRAISEKVLSQSLGRPTLIAISSLIEQDKKAYYSKLQKNSSDLEITDWLEYFCELVLKAQEYTQRMIDFLVEKSEYYRMYNHELNERQKKVIDRVFKAGVNGFKGGLSADNYMSISGTSASTATRDLQKLVDLGALVRKGERKGTRYYLTIDHPVGNAHGLIP